MESQGLFPGEFHILRRERRKVADVAECGELAAKPTYVVDLNYYTFERCVRAGHCGGIGKDKKWASLSGAPCAMAHARGG